MEQQQQQKVPGRTERAWPHLLKEKYSKAREKILEDDGTLLVERVPEGSMVTMDYRLDRVRLFVDKDDIVVEVPRTG